MSPLLETFGFSSVRGYRGANGAAAGSYELIATAFGSGSSATVTFASIPAGYKHLQMRMMVNTTLTYEQGSSMQIRFNGDAGANYTFHQLAGNGSGVNASSGLANNGARISYLSVPNNAITGMVVDILDAFSTTKNTTVRALNGYAWTSQNISLRSCLWINTAAITSISVVEENASNWSTRSRFSLYGIKG